jgi:hypothetical protein
MRRKRTGKGKTTARTSGRLAAIPRSSIEQLLDLLQAARFLWRSSAHFFLSLGTKYLCELTLFATPHWGTKPKHQVTTLHRDSMVCSRAAHAFSPHSVNSENAAWSLLCDFVNRAPKP